MAKILVQNALQEYTSGKKELRISFNNCRDFASELKRNLPQLFDVLYDKNKKFNGYIAIFKNKKQINMMDDACSFTDDDIIEIILPQSGG